STGSPPSGGRARSLARAGPARGSRARGPPLRPAPDGTRPPAPPGHRNRRRRGRAAPPPGRRPGPRRGRPRRSRAAGRAPRAALLGDFGNDPTALTAYAINVGLAGLADALMLTVALCAHLLEPDTQARGAQLLARDLIAPAVFFASIPLAYADTNLAKYSWL